MKQDPDPNDDSLTLPVIRPDPTPTVADRVFDELQKRILSLKLPPATKISEIVVARQMGVSRQPVREAFKRLAKLGFLLIRPQSSTTVSFISEAAVLRARFIRTALEIHTCRTACVTFDQTGLDALAALIEEQRKAIEADDAPLFHALDDQFHREICIQSGVGYVWDMIHDSKAHMDRIRRLSLTTASQKFALEGHIEIFNAIKTQDEKAAATAIDKHLSRILVLIDEIKATNHSWFTDIST